MKTKILNILCEGVTEAYFAAQVLAPHLKPFGIVVKPRRLTTSKRNHAAGGMISFAQVERDLRNWVREVSGRSSEVHYFTTMFDFYALPDDFPNFATSVGIADRYLAVSFLESHMAAALSFCPNFIPYIQLHEFEALLFCGLDLLKAEFPNSARAIDTLNDALRQAHDNPELVNNKRETAPSKRIIHAVESNRRYHYNKPLMGVNVTHSIGIEALKSRCSHFGAWVTQLEQLSA